MYLLAPSIRLWKTKRSSDKLNLRLTDLNASEGVTSLALGAIKCIVGIAGKTPLCQKRKIFNLIRDSNRGTRAAGRWPASCHGD